VNGKEPCCISSELGNADRGSGLTSWSRAWLCFPGFVETPSDCVVYACLCGCTSQAIDSRVGLYPQLLKVYGRLSLITAHSAHASSSAAGGEGGEDGEDGVPEPEVVFEDGDDDEPEAEDPFAPLDDDEDEDDEEGDEDAEGDADMSEDGSGMYSEEDGDDEDDEDDD
jgi:hypothetical protein